MRGNNREIERQHMEDEIINRIDMPTRRWKDPRPLEVYLRVPILELLSYKAAMTGRVLRMGAWRAICIL